MSIATSRGRVGRGSRQKTAAPRPVDPFDRAPPASPEIELALLGSLVLDWPRAPEVLARIEPSDFSNERFQAIARALKVLVLMGKPCDAPLLIQQLKASGDFERLGSWELIEELFSRPPVAAHLDYYAEEFIKAAKHRKLHYQILDLWRCSAEGDVDKLLELYRSFESKEAVSSADSTFSSLDFATLLNTDFKVEMLVDHVLPAAQGGVMSGAYKTCKSGVSTDLALSLASGTPYLGYDGFSVPEAMPAGIFTFESGWPTIKQRCKAIAHAKGIDADDLGSRFQISTELPRLALMPDQAKLERFIVKWGLRLCIIDPSYLAFTGAGDNTPNLIKMGDTLLPLTEIIARTGCTILLVNHNRKNRPNDRQRFAPPDLNEISGSGFAEWLRFYVLLGHREEWDEQTGHFRLWMRTGGSIGHGGFHQVDVLEGKPEDVGGRGWSVSVEAASKAAQAEQASKQDTREQQRQDSEERDNRKVVEVMRQIGKPATLTTIRDLASLNGDRGRAAINRLVGSGEVIACDVPPERPRGRTQSGYRLKESE